MISDFFAVLDQNTTIGWSFIILLSVVVGAVLHRVINHLPKMMEQEWRAECLEFLENDKKNGVDATSYSFLKPRPACQHCGSALKLANLVPLLSLLIGRQCGSCNKTLSLRYPIIVMATAILSVVVVAHTGFTPVALLGLGFTWVLITAAIIDFDTFLLPDSLTLPLIWAGLIINHFGVFTTLPDALWGAVWGYGSLWGFCKLFKLVTGKDGMGYGDFKLFAVFGAWMGWQVLPQIIILSAFVGAIVGVSLMVVLGRSRNVPIPFGPYLAAAGWIAFIWGETINQMYIAYFFPA